MEKGIQYLKELALWKVIHEDLDKDPDEVKCKRPMWQKFVWSAPLSYDSSLVAMTCKDGDGQLMDELSGQFWQYEESISSSLGACISAVEKMS